MIAYLEGKKTYIVAACGVLYAIFGFVTGHLDSNTAIDTIFAALAVMGLRDGITTELQSLAGFLPDKTLPMQSAPLASPKPVPDAVLPAGTKKPDTQAPSN